MMARRPWWALRCGLAARIVGAAALLAPALAAAEEEPAEAHPIVDAICARGTRLEQVAEYESAAELLEECAKLSGAEGPLARAIVLRLGLDQRDVAFYSVARYVRWFGKTNPAMASSVVLALALSHEEREDWARALQVMEERRDLLRAAPMEVRVRAHVAKGLALLATRKGTEGLAELAAARALYGDGEAIEKEIATSWPAAEPWQKDRRLGKVIQAYGVALVTLADAERTTRLAGLAPPVYAGPRTEAAVLAFLAAKGPPWMVKRRAALAAAEGPYLAVLDIKPVPPPAAVIDAASAVASMWADYADDIARIVPRDGWPPSAGATAGRPPPAVVRGVAELRDSVTAQHVLPAMKKCLDLSVKYQFTDARSRACEAWLTKNDPDHYHAGSELSPGVRVPGRAWVNAAPQRARPPSP